MTDTATHKAIHNSIGTFYFNELDFDDAGGRTLRRVKVPTQVVRSIVDAGIAVHEQRKGASHD